MQDDSLGFNEILEEFSLFPASQAAVLGHLYIGKLINRSRKRTQDQWISQR